MQFINYKSKELMIIKINNDNLNHELNKTNWSINYCKLYISISHMRDDRAAPEGGQEGRPPQAPEIQTAEVRVST
jgi:hypothetical protein